MLFLPILATLASLLHASSSRSSSHSFDMNSFILDSSLAEIEDGAELSRLMLNERMSKSELCWHHFQKRINKLFYPIWTFALLSTLSSVSSASLSFQTNTICGDTGNQTGGPGCTPDVMSRMHTEAVICAALQGASFFADTLLWSSNIKLFRTEISLIPIILLIAVFRSFSIGYSAGMVGGAEGVSLHASFAGAALSILSLIFLVIAAIFGPVVYSVAFRVYKRIDEFMKMLWQRLDDLCI